MRAVLFSNEVLGLGHLRRTLALAEALVEHEPGWTALVVTGSQCFAGMRVAPGVDVVKLPTAPVGADSSWGAAERSAPAGLDLPEPEVRDLRARIAALLVEDVRPDVVVVDHRPLGRDDELLPALEALRARRTCVAALGLRDVADAPEVLGPHWTPAAVRTTARLYDLALVYGPSAPDDVRVTTLRASGLPVHTTGRVATRLPASGPADLGDGYLLATVGGGVDGFALLSVVLAALERGPLDTPVVLVTGPMMGAAEAADLRARGAGAGVRVLSERPDMDAVVAGAAATICMGGYSTTAEVLASGRPALLVPRAFPNEEQLVRARALEAEGLVTVLHPDDLGASSLRSAIDALLRRPARRAEAPSGATDVARILTAAVHARSPAARAPVLG